MSQQKSIKRYRVEPGKKVHLRDYATGWTETKERKGDGMEQIKRRAHQSLEKNLLRLAEAQQVLFADDRYSLLIVLQAMDAGGKDSTIRHVMSGVNPQGCQVYAFKTPSSEDLDHNFLWRYMRCLPERGRIGIFNRSYYEDVLVPKVHPELLERQQLPPGKRGRMFWQARYDDINSFERHLVGNGTCVLKFFLHLSKEEQKKRFLKRLDHPEKNWKFSSADLSERQFWESYQNAYADAIGATSTEWAPWYIIPADDKWAARTLVADIISHSLSDLKLKFPTVSDSEKQALAQAREQLENE